MNDYETVLWYRDERSDKVWGVTSQNGNPVSFWGKREGDLQFKNLTEKEAASLKKKKIAKGYREVSMDDLGEHFVSNFQNRIVMSILGDKIGK